MNTRAPQLDQQELLDRLVARLHETLGERLHSVRLYGSWARGEAGEGSDIDVIITVDQISTSSSLWIRSTKQLGKKLGRQGIR